MASGAKKRTTMAKLMRENRLRERRLDKQAKKDARKRSTGEQSEPPLDPADASPGEPPLAGAAQPAAELEAHALADA